MDEPDEFVEDDEYVFTEGVSAAPPSPCVMTGDEWETGLMVVKTVDGGAATDQGHLYIRDNYLAAGEVRTRACSLVSLKKYGSNPAPCRSSKRGPFSMPRSPFGGESVNYQRGSHSGSSSSSSSSSNSMSRCGRPKPTLGNLHRKHVLFVRVRPRHLFSSFRPFRPIRRGPRCGNLSGSRTTNSTSRCQ